MRIIVPTFNEAESLPLLLTRIRAATPQAHILIVDDNSPDGTGRIADDAAADDAHIEVLHRSGKEGLGAAYLDAFTRSLLHDWDVLVEMDADGSHAPEQLPSLLAPLDDGADLVLGSRYVAEGSVVNWPWHRLLLSRGGNLYARILLGLPLHDATGGYRAFHRSVLDATELGSVSTRGYGFQVDMARRAHQAGHRIQEVPITFTERIWGESKMSHSIIFEALLATTGWGLQRRAEQLRRITRRQAAQPAAALETDSKQ